MHAKHIFVSIVLGLALMSALLGCRGSSYSGDGVLADYGASHPTHHYILDLGAIDFSTNGLHKFKVSALPRKEFTFGFRLMFEPPLAKADELPQIHATARITLTDSAGKIVVNERAALSDWTWNYPSNKDWAFLYRRRGDNHNGTYLIPQRDMQYTLEIEITDAAGAQRNSTARLIAESGGWK